MTDTSRGLTAYAAARSRKAVLIAATSMVALSIAAPVYAQDAVAPIPATTTPNSTASSVEEVVVTGIRGSLQRNLDIKRDASGVVDAISAEDIGKFPDSNVASALQRLPGLSIQRN